MFGDVYVHVLERMLQCGDENTPHSRTTRLIEIGILLHTRCRLAVRNRRVDTRSRGTPLLPGHRARGLVTDLPADDRSAHVRKIWKWLVFLKIFCKNRCRPHRNESQLYVVFHKVQMLGFGRLLLCLIEIFQLSVTGNSLASITRNQWKRNVNWRFHYFYLFISAM